MIYETSSIYEFRRNFSGVGANQSGELAVFRGIPLKRCLLIFDSRVVPGTPSLAAVPDGPDTLPWHSNKAASIRGFSPAGLFKRPGRYPGHRARWTNSAAKANFNGKTLIHIQQSAPVVK